VAVPGFGGVKVRGWIAGADLGQGAVIRHEEVAVDGRRRGRLGGAEAAGHGEDFDMGDEELWIRRQGREGGDEGEDEGKERAQKGREGSFHICS